MEAIENLLAEALASLGGNERYVAGATLGARAHKLAKAQGVDLRAELRTYKSTLLQMLLASEAFDVVERPDTDFFVRLKQGASSEKATSTVSRLPLRPTSSGQKLRADVYDAFTRVGTNYAYRPGADRFEPVANIDSSAESQVVSVPTVTMDTVTKDRTLFAETLPEPLNSAARELLVGEYGLRQFKEFLKTKRRFPEWLSFHNQILSSRAVQWARENGLKPSDAWFETTEQPSTETFRKNVAHIIMGMSDDDLEALVIPLKYLKHLLSK